MIHTLQLVGGRFPGTEVTDNAKPVVRLTWKTAIESTAAHERREEIRITREVVTNASTLGTEVP